MSDTQQALNQYPSFLYSDDSYNQGYQRQEFCLNHQKIHELVQSETQALFEVFCVLWVYHMASPKFFLDSLLKKIWK